MKPKRILLVLLSVLMCAALVMSATSCSSLRDTLAAAVAAKLREKAGETTAAETTADTVAEPETDADTEPETEPETDADTESETDEPVDYETYYPFYSYEVESDWIRPVDDVTFTASIEIYDGSHEDYDLHMCLPELTTPFDTYYGNFTARAETDLNNAGFINVMYSLREGTYSGDYLYDIGYNYTKWDDVYAVVCYGAEGLPYSEWYNTFIAYYFDSDGNVLSLEECLARRGFTLDDFYYAFDPVQMEFYGDSKIAEELYGMVMYFAFSDVDENMIYVCYSDGSDSYYAAGWIALEHAVGDNVSQSVDTPFLYYWDENEYVEPGLVAEVEVTSDDGGVYDCCYVMPHIKVGGDAANIDALIRGRLEAEGIASLADSVTDGTCTADNIICFTYFHAE